MIRNGGQWHCSGGADCADCDHSSLGACNEFHPGCCLSRTWLTGSCFHRIWRASQGPCELVDFWARRAHPIRIVPNHRTVDQGNVAGRLSERIWTARCTYLGKPFRLTLLKETVNSHLMALLRGGHLQAVHCLSTEILQVPLTTLCDAVRGEEFCNATESHLVQYRGPKAAGMGAICHSFSGSSSQMS